MGLPLPPLTACHMTQVGLEASWARLGAGLCLQVLPLLTPELPPRTLKGGQRRRGQALMMRRPQMMHTIHTLPRHLVSAFCDIVLPRLLYAEYQNSCLSTAALQEWKIWPYMMIQQGLQQ